MSDTDDEFDLDFVNNATKTIMSNWSRGQAGKDQSEDVLRNLTENVPIPTKKKKKIDSFIDSPVRKTKPEVEYNNSEENEDDEVPENSTSKKSGPITITPPGSPTGSQVENVRIRGAKRTKKTEQALKKIGQTKFASSLKRNVNLGDLPDANTFSCKQSVESNTFDLKIRLKADIVRIQVNGNDKMGKVIDQIAENANIASKELHLYKDQASLEPISREDTVRGLGLSLVSVLLARERVAAVDGGTGDGDGSMELKLQTKDRKVAPVMIKVEPGDKMEAVMEKFCATSGMERTKLKFFFDGEQLDPESTAEDLELEGGECIDVHVSDK